MKYFCIVIQQLTRFQLPQGVARSLCNIWLLCWYRL